MRRHGGLVQRMVSAGVVAVVLAAGLIAAGTTAAGTAAAATSAPGTFVALSPTRVLDTRSGLGATQAPVSPLGTVHLQVTGRGGVPASGVAAVLLNVTVTDTRGGGFVTAWPDGQTRPTASNLNFLAGQVVPNLVAVGVGTGGGVALYNGSAGTADLVADVAGYYVGGTATVPGAFTALTPARLLDTRSGVGAPTAPVAPGGTVSVAVTGRGGVPSSGVTAVLLNVTVTNTRAGGFVTAYPGGTARPTASNINFSAGSTIANLVAVPVGADGTVALYNGGGTGQVDLLADVAGWYRSGTPTDAGAFASLSPTRLLDTRSGLGAPQRPVSPGLSLTLQVTGRGGVPTTGVAAVLLNVTVVNPSGGGYVTAYPDGTGAPTASNLNFVPHAIVANLVSVRVGSGGRVDLYNGSTGTTDLVADVAGYVLTGADSTPPGAVTGVKVTGTTTTTVSLAWTNPTDSDFAGVLIRRATGSTPPSSPTAGTAVYDFGGSTDTDGGLAAGTTYSYALFAHDNVPNYAAAATVTVTTALGPTGAVMGLGSVDWTKDSTYYGWYNWADPDVVRLYTDAAGDLGVATYHPSSRTITAQSFDPGTRRQVGPTTTVTLPSAYPLWGGLYAAPTGDFYVATGRENPNENDNLDVVAIQRYDEDWHLVGTAYVKGGATQSIKGIYTPFEAGAAHMVLVGSTLVVHMSRLMYAINDVHHQSNMTLTVDVDAMTARTFDDAYGGNPYSSHSFQQLVTMNGSDLVLVDHGDAYPRAVQVSVVADFPQQHDFTQRQQVFGFDGAVGDNFTGATVTGLASGPSGVVVVGNSIAQPDAPNGAQGSNSDNRNIYTVAVDPSTGAHTVRWLTTYSATGAQNALQPRVVQVATDRFAVLFTVTNGNSSSTQYRLIDSAGTLRASASFPSSTFAAGTDPTRLGSRIYWAGQVSGTGYVYGLDVSDPTHPALVTG